MDIGHSFMVIWEEIITNYRGYPENVYDELSYENEKNQGNTYDESII